ncbi:MAG TPA: protealysin inhibitor emfourin [Micromonosporaceae bacterium]|nr:protealysin inhibitor emfourin [Micromonosporaceae bacterium]
MNLNIVPVRRIAALGAALAGLAAAALVTPAASAAPTPGASTSAAPAAQRIELTRSGGIAGEFTRFVIDASNTDRDAVRALRLAGSSQFRALAPSYRPADLCCDHFQYDLTVSYADGTTKIVQTWSNAEAPKVLRRVIGLTEQAGTRVPSPVPALAQRIELARSGGFAGRTVRFVLDRSDTGPDATQALELADTAEFRALARMYGPANPCCDHFQYDLTVLHSDGGTQTVTSWGPSEVPQVLLDVIRLTERSGRTPVA